ncbi:MAG: trypsin-like peptidase domain-containing protein [Thermoleophilaceae bacterium]|nr:trypsin-like peptidase domain-containing protein [Thermoleophilaceae bacterium]
MNRRTLCLTILAAGLLGAAVPATAAGAPIQPGVMTNSPSGQCTSNFVFRDRKATFIGQAAHCTGRGSPTQSNGCETDSFPLGTKVEIDGATQPGKLAYSSWLTMQKVGETDRNACEYNDFALIRIARRDVSRVDPSVQGFGGPTGVGSSSAMLGDSVFAYGNSSLRGGSTLLSPKQGIVLGSEGDGWSRTVLTVTPGIPGDSGSGLVSASGKAIGVISTLELLPRAATNGVSDLSRALGYAHQNTSLDKLRLVPGTKRFRPSLVDAILGR